MHAVLGVAPLYILPPVFYTLHPAAREHDTSVSDGRLKFRSSAFSSCDRTGWRYGADEPRCVTQGVSSVIFEAPANGSARRLRYDERGRGPNASRAPRLYSSRILICG